MLRQLKSISQKQMGYLVGLYFGDGYIYHDKKTRHYVVEFFLDTIRNQNIIPFVIKILKKQGQNSFLIKDKRGNCSKVKVNSKLLYLYMKNYRLKNLKKEKKDFKLGFISGVIDGEGSIYNSTICVINTDQELLAYSCFILDEFNIGYSLKKRVRSKKDKKDSYRLLVYVKFKKLDHICQKILKPYETQQSKQINTPQNQKHY